MEILTGVSKSALSRIEKGEVALDLDVAEMIADGLHIGIDDLYESAVKHKKCPDIGTRQGKKEVARSTIKGGRDMGNTKEEIAKLYEVVLKMEENELEEYREIVFRSATLEREKALIHNFFLSAECERKKKGSH